MITIMSGFHRGIPPWVAHCGIPPVVFHNGHTCDGVPHWYSTTGASENVTPGTYSLMSIKRHLMICYQRVFVQSSFYKLQQVNTEYNFGLPSEATTLSATRQAYNLYQVQYDGLPLGWVGEWVKLVVEQCGCQKSMVKTKPVKAKVIRPTTAIRLFYIKGITM